MEVTIITTTYNRAEELKRLYTSLKKQTIKDFKWLIIDDGSTDNTKNIVDSFKKENIIQIKYSYMQNSGKHVALNYGIEQIDTELTFCVDSDDYITEDAIEKIIKVHEKYKNNLDICGYSFIKIDSQNRVNGKVVKENEVIDDFINIRINGKDTKSDKAEVWKTNILKKYPFPEFEGEKFLGEDTVWLQMALKYKMVFFKEPIYIGEYLEGGLTKNRRKNNIKSPNGCMYRAKVTLEIAKKRKVNFKYFSKCMLQYGIYGKFANKKFKELYKEVPFKIYFTLLYPCMQIIYVKWKKDNLK